MSKLEALFNPKSIAIVGASPNAGSITGQPLRHLLDRNYSGKIYPVTEKYEEIAGLKCYRAISQLPEPPDVAVLVIGAARVPGVLKECCAKGVRFAVIVSAGFAEAGAEGRKLQDEIGRICRGQGIRLVGPNCQGMMNVAANVCAGFGPVLGVQYGVQAGPVSVITQSGGFGFAFVSLMARQGIGFSKIISTGNEADLGAADYLEHFIQDPATRVIVAYLEGIEDGRRVRDLGELALERDKPILVWKVGSTEVGKRAASSHTGKLSGDHAIHSAVIKQMGSVEIDDVQDLVDYSRAFLNGKRPQGRRVAILSASGGAGVLISDECSRLGLEVSPLSEESKQRLVAIAPALGSLQNPIDAMGGIYDDPARLGQALEVLAADAATDSIVIINPLRQGQAAAGIARSIVGLHAATDKPVFVTWSARPDFAEEGFSILRAAGVPHFDTPVRCARALSVLTLYVESRRRLRNRLLEHIPACEQPAARALLLSSKDSALNEYRSKQILSLYGIPVTREGLARSVDEAISIAGTLSYPVAVKVQSVDIAHKTDAKAIRVHIRSAEELSAAYAEVIDNAKRHAREARIDGVLVQEMIAGGVETILGAVCDPSFGPVVMFGLGGIYAQIIGDVSFRAAPIVRSQALEMIAETKCYGILIGARSGIPADIDALADAILKVSAMVVDLQNELSELDINPLVVMPTGQGVKALDALITLRPGRTKHRCH